MGQIISLNLSIFVSRNHSQPVQPGIIYDFWHG